MSGSTGSSSPQVSSPQIKLSDRGENNISFVLRHDGQIICYLQFCRLMCNWDSIPAGLSKCSLTALEICLCSCAMSDITLEELRDFSEASSSLVTADAPLFGLVMILHGRVLGRGPHEAAIGASMGFPLREHVISEASRFWIQSDDGVRELKTRDQMAELLREYQRAAGAS